MIKAYKEGRIKLSPYAFKGKHHSDETKIKIGIINSFHQQGNKNSQFGSMWITNGIDNKKIKKEDFIPEGWYKGRNLSPSSNVQDTALSRR